MVRRLTQFILGKTDNGKTTVDIRSDAGAKITADELEALQSALGIDTTPDAGGGGGSGGSGVASQVITADIVCASGPHAIFTPVSVPDGETWVFNFAGALKTSSGSIEIDEDIPSMGIFPSFALSPVTDFDIAWNPITELWHDHTEPVRTDQYVIDLTGSFGNPISMPTRLIAFPMPFSLSRLVMINHSGSAQNMNFTYYLQNLNGADYINILKGTHMTYQKLG